MVDLNIISVKLDELHDRVRRIRKHCPPTHEALAADRDAMDIVAFNLLLAVQACADIASHIISDESWGVVTVLAAGFTRLHERGVLSEQSAAAMRKAAGFRNIVAHGYAGVNVRILHLAGTAGLAELERFAQEIASWVRSQAQA